MQADPIFRTRDTLSYLKVSRSTLERWVKSGLLPAPVKLGPRAVGWRQSTLDAFVAARGK